VDLDKPANRGCWAPELKGKTAIVTGAGRYRSIGREVALELARQGVNLVLTGSGKSPDLYPEEEKAIGWRDIDSVAAEVAAAGATALPLVSDAGDPEAIAGLVEATRARFGGVDILINNASVAIGADRVPVVDLPLGEWDKLMEVNLRGAFLIAQASARAMVERGKGGCILNISSIASRLGAATNAAYAVSKAGLNTLSRVMAMELASERIRVNAVLPGMIETARMWRLTENPERAAAIKAFVPLGTPGDGSEIAWMCSYLCSDMGAWITGQEIAVDGGTTWH
jgi:3-oxoacyl-[acyl-carrier protein] reductase/meso-butanediol dehydrogenase/(S,S)-butanediol dehydrogenase/diacetyl reductase